MESFMLASIADTEKFARSIAALCKKGDVICLNGSLGCGKTTFTRFFISSIAGHNIKVTSPTFNLLQIYDVLAKGQVWHFDFYRIENSDELVELGLDDAYSQITLIEWANKFPKFLPLDRLEIYFTIKGKKARQVEVRRYGVWRGRKIEYN